MARHYKALFFENEVIRPIFCCDKIEKISVDDVKLLEKQFSEKEVWEAIQGCGADKAPGPDGFNFKFIRKMWDIIKADLMRAITWFWEKMEISRGCNASFVIIIPKVADPIGLGDFRPISLIGCYYKVIAKMLAKRVKRVVGGRGGGRSKSVHPGSSSMSILVNGSPSEEFGLERVLGKWNKENAKYLMCILKCFEEVSGLRVNFNKSKLYGIGVNEMELADMARRMGCGVREFPFMYLRLPIGENMSRLNAWNPVVEKFKKRLADWKAKTMSFGGRLTLVKLVLGVLGDGRDIRFWVDRWVDNRRLCDAFPRLYHLDRRKEGSVMDKRTWVNDVWDRWRWMQAEDGEFKVKELSRLIEEKILQAESRLPVHVELDRRGIDLDSVLCPCCNSVVESCAHSLVTCDLAMSVWEKETAFSIVMRGWASVVWFLLVSVCDWLFYVVSSGVWKKVLPAFFVVDVVCYDVVCKCVWFAFGELVCICFVSLLFQLCLLYQSGLGWSWYWVKWQWSLPLLICLLIEIKNTSIYGGVPKGPQVRDLQCFSITNFEYNFGNHDDLATCVEYSDTGIVFPDNEGQTLEALNQTVKTRFTNPVLRTGHMDNTIANLHLIYAIYLSNILIVCLYDDDLIYTGNDQEMFVVFKKSMMTDSDMTDLGTMRYFLVHNPAVPGLKLTKDEEGTEVDGTIYRQMVGSLMYLTTTCPDLMFIKYISESSVIIGQNSCLNEERVY
ncbi:reverse transcriptase domain, reverse transcriptase zinc-binding domain protein [Tanacetum coccineum]